MNVSFDEYYRKYHAYVLRVCGKLRDDDLAKDAAQEVWICFHARLSSGQQISKPQHLLSKIAHDVAVNFIRKRESERQDTQIPGPLEDVKDEPGPRKKRHGTIEKETSDTRLPLTLRIATFSKAHYSGKKIQKLENPTKKAGRNSHDYARKAEETSAPWAAGSCSDAIVPDYRPGGRVPDPRLLESIKLSRFQATVIIMDMRKFGDFAIAVYLGLTTKRADRLDQLAAESKVRYLRTKAYRVLEKLGREKASAAIEALAYKFHLTAIAETDNMPMWDANPTHRAKVLNQQTRNFVEFLESQRLSG